MLLPGCSRGSRDSPLAPLAIRRRMPQATIPPPPPLARYVIFEYVTQHSAQPGPSIDMHAVTLVSCRGAAQPDVDSNTAVVSRRHTYGT